MKGKLAIVMSGGGVTCSYSVGVLLALIKKYNLKKPDILIAASGSSGTASYYAANQYASMLNIWSNLLSTKKFVNKLRFWKIIDIDYLIDEVFKKQDELNAKNIHKSKINFLIAATNYDSGSVEYFSPKEHDIFEIMRASKALPLAFGKTVKIDDERYCDTSNSSCGELNILKAVDLGANRVIAIDNSNSTGLSDFAFYLWLMLKSKKFRNNYSEYGRKRKEFRVPESAGIIFLRPKNKLRITRLNNGKKLIDEAIRQGYDETISNKDLRLFFDSLNR